MQGSNKSIKKTQTKHKNKQKPTRLMNYKTVCPLRLLFFCYFVSILVKKFIFWISWWHKYSFVQQMPWMSRKCNQNALVSLFHFSYTIQVCVLDSYNSFGCKSPLKVVP